MTANLTRRTALAGAAAGTLIPVAGLARGANTTNATDAAWADYQGASAAYEAEVDAWHAFEAQISEQTGPQPVYHLYDNPAEWRERHDA